MLKDSKLRFTDLHLQSASRKLERILSKCIGWIPGGKTVARWCKPVTSKLLFATHTCFLNQDQEYVAVKG